MNVSTTEHLSRTVGDMTLVDDISVEVRAGEMLAVVPDSAGKSSFSVFEPPRRAHRGNGVARWRRLSPDSAARASPQGRQGDAAHVLISGTVYQNAGFGPRQSVGGSVQESFEASVIPAVDSLHSPGIAGFPS